jgi:hypothetical protein
LDVVLRVANEERQIDQIVRVRQVPQVAEEHGQMRRCISQWRAQQYPLLAFPSSRRAPHIVEVVVSHRLELRVLAGDVAKGAGAQVRSQVGEEEKQGRQEQGPGEQQALY